MPLRPANNLVVLAVFFFQLLTPAAKGAVFQFEPACTNFTFPPPGAEVRELCYGGGGSTPSPAGLENGTTIYVGGFSWEYSFSNEELESLSVVVRFEDDQSCSVTINGDETCSTCSKCDPAPSGYEEIYSTDCTNIEGGRNVVCEPVTPVFFPMSPTYGLEDEGDGMMEDGGGDDEGSGAAGPSASVLAAAAISVLSLLLMTWM